MGCKRYGVANGLSILFTSCFTTACGNQDILKSMSLSSRYVNKSMDCSLRFRLRLCLDLSI